jgi:repressor LexA
MLTLRQKSIFDFIVEFRRQQGCSPSIPEIQRAFAIRSPNGVAGHILALEAKGMIRRARRGSRQIEITGPLHSMKSQVFDLPVFSRSPQDPPEGCVSIDETTLGFCPEEGSFALKVRGNSRRDAGILDGDLVVVDPQGAVRTIIRKVH